MKNKAYLRSILDGKTKYYNRKLEIQKNLIEQQWLITISLNIPGWPKINNQIERFLTISKDIIQNSLNLKTIEYMINAAGGFYFMISKEQPFVIKHKCVAIEESSVCFRLLDIDCFDRNHRPISRTEVGYTARKCLICSNNSDQCIEKHIHSLLDLRQRANELISLYLTPNSYALRRPCYVTSNIGNLQC